MKDRLILELEIGDITLGMHTIYLWFADDPMLGRHILVHKLGYQAYWVPPVPVQCTKSVRSPLALGRTTVVCA
jgi:hypothetical protein